MEQFSKSLRRQHSVIPAIEDAKSIDQIDFDLKARLQGGCKTCSGGKMPFNSLNYMQKDPKMYDYIVQQR